MNEKPLTGLRKRQQIASTNRQTLVWVGIASSLVVICTVLAINFFQDITYQIKVNSQLGDTANTLSTSVNNIPKLITSVGNLSTDQNLTSSNLNSYTDANGNSQSIPAQQVVLYAMPTTNDPTYLSVTLQSILSAAGVNLSQISITNSNSSSGSAVASTNTASNSSSASTGASSNSAQPVQFSITINGSPNDGSIKKALETLENTTRIITVNSITTQTQQTVIQATAYYAPKIKYQVGTEEIKP